MVPRGLISTKLMASRPRTPTSLAPALGPLKGDGLVLCPWASADEWLAVYGWLYSEEPAVVQQGVGRVAVWKARGIHSLPAAVEMTADIVECQLSERRMRSSTFHEVCLSYSMAITRFINGVSDMVKARGWEKRDIRSAVIEYGVPSWMVSIRHEGTHSFLPSLGEFHIAAQFALSWLRANYWRPQRKLIDKQGKSCSSAPNPEVLLTKARQPSSSQPSLNSGTKDGAVSRLTCGLCTTKSDLIELLVGSDQGALTDCILRRQLLQMPQTVKYSVRVPPASDLDEFPTLSGDLATWRKYLLKAAHRDISVKQRLASSLIAATHSSEDVQLRNYLCSWLKLLLVEDYAVERIEQSKVDVVTIVADDDQFVPGTLDWIKLSNTAKDHPGYYTYAICKVIDGHLQSIASESVREKILYLSKLLALSQRIGASSYIPGSRQGQYLVELEATINNYKVKQSNISWEPPTKRLRLRTDQKWKVVSNMLPWIHTPLGQCPGQVISPDFLDLPVWVNKQRSGKFAPKPLSESKVTATKTNSEEMLNSRMLSVRDRVELF